MAVTDVPLSRPVVRLGAVGPADAVAAIRALLGAAVPAGLEINLEIEEPPETGDPALDAVLLVVTVEEGVTDELRGQLRHRLQPGPPAPVVAFLDGCDRVPEGQGFILDLIELDLRGTVSALGLSGESLPVIRGSARQALAPEPAEEWTAPIRALAAALAPDRVEQGFRMSIGDVVPTRRGAVVLGRIESGEVCAGADVEIAGLGQGGRTARVRGVMRAWDLVPAGRPGEDVGLFLEKIRLTDFLGARSLVQPAPPAAPPRPVPAENSPAENGPADAGYFAVPVFYATDRKRTEEPAPRLVYGGERSERGELAFGVAEVSLPRSRRRAGLPVPPWWRLELAEDLARHIVLLDVDELGREPFLAELRRTVRRAGSPEVLVFVHGYDVTFEDAARHAAQLADALGFWGVPLLYSWPSEGKAHRYTVDEANVEWARVHAAELLRLVLAESGARSVHVIAHGMGSRALARALGDLEARPAESGEKMPGEDKAALRQIVFAAPDIDRETFLGLVPRMRDRAERFTLYGSSNDRALQAARIVHSRPRAGESGDAMAVAEGIDSIDAADADTSLQERSGPTILTGIAALLRSGPPA